MAGSGDERGGGRRQKGKDVFKSLLSRSKARPVETGEQSSSLTNKLSATPKKIDEAEAPKVQSISSIAQTTNLGPVNDPAMERAPKILPALAAAQSMTELSATKNAPDTTPSKMSDPDQPATNDKDLPLVSAVDKVATSHIISDQPSQAPKPIYELWNEAYEELKDKEQHLVNDYEAAMSKDMTTILGGTSLALLAPQISVRRKEQMVALLEKKIAEAKKNAWKLKYGTDNEVLLRDLANPVINIIKEAETFVNGAVSANPYASIAWAGVSLLLPVSLAIRY